MIGVIDIEVQARNPEAPLYPLKAFVNSPSSIRVRNAPRRIGDWHLTKVYISAVYPDGQTTTVQCVPTGGVWVGTLAGTATSGTTENGYTILADGIDENMNAVTGYVLGKGDIFILNADGTPAPDAPTHYVRLLSSESTAPVEGDMFPTESGYSIWQDGEAHQLGMTREDFSKGEILLPYLSDMIFQMDEPTPNGRRDAPVGIKDLRWKFDTID